jgi:hypothetical protein
MRDRIEAAVALSTRTSCGTTRAARAARAATGISEPEPELLAVPDVPPLPAAAAVALGACSEKGCAAVPGSAVEDPVDIHVPAMGAAPAAAARLPARSARPSAQALAADAETVIGSEPVVRSSSTGTIGVVSSSGPAAGVSVVVVEDGTDPDSSTTVCSTTVVCSITRTTVLDLVEVEVEVAVCVVSLITLVVCVRSPAPVWVTDWTVELTFAATAVDSFVEVVVDSVVPDCMISDATTGLPPAVGAWSATAVDVADCVVRADISTVAAFGAWTCSASWMRSSAAPTREPSDADATEPNRRNNSTEMATPRSPQSAARTAPLAAARTGCPGSAIGIGATAEALT